MAKVKIHFHLLTCSPVLVCSRLPQGPRQPDSEDQVHWDMWAYVRPRICKHCTEPQVVWSSHVSDSQYRRHNKKEIWGDIKPVCMWYFSSNEIIILKYFHGRNSLICAIASGKHQPLLHCYQPPRVGFLSLPVNKKTDSFKCKIMLIEIFILLLSLSLLLPVWVIITNYMKWKVWIGQKFSLLIARKVVVMFLIDW